MNQLFHKLKKVFLTLLYINIIYFPSAYAQNIESPHEFLSKVSENVIRSMKGNLNPNNIDMVKLNEIIELYMTPHVDFEKITRLTTSHHWKKVTQEQKIELIKAFRNKLIKTYTLGLLKISPDSTLLIKPNKNQTNLNNALVNAVIQQPNGQRIQIGYRLYLNDNKWKIYDINIEGIWLIDSYRGQFNQEINKHGIEKLIKNLNNNNY
ncbi:putative toluene tolerance protein [Candidatus Kinetoplastibacterium desouzaii TCC079E]|uniref:Putative toluene tolerance protein n=1 Tax=Candidatus Kinetoplastidibacterium desouzai TCC079E TaxID=1208919 RepID=M1M2Q9_9PROT|nr:ABC transporter substrate-binding protein [Candidatus Kinetoplastibacterium desouzaii]AGF46590.1 putative toluene tolerance protein [Candidatus Kinetoplastibacterium desouzaii TCC079E]